jgi:hypothetical protein
MPRIRGNGIRDTRRWSVMACLFSSFGTDLIARAEIPVTEIIEMGVPTAQIIQFFLRINGHI